MMFERQHFLGLVELRRQAPSWGWNSNNLASPFLCIPDTLSGTLSNGYDKRIYVWWTGTDSLNIIPLLRGHLIWDSHRLGVGRDWGAHIWRDTTGNTGSLLLRTIFNDGDTIQYRLLNTTMYTGYILYAKKVNRGQWERNETQYRLYSTTQNRKLQRTAG